MTEHETRLAGIRVSAPVFWAVHSVFFGLVTVGLMSGWFFDLFDAVSPVILGAAEQSLGISGIDPASLSPVAALGLALVISFLVAIVIALYFALVFSSFVLTFVSVLFFILSAAKDYSEH